jgi:4,4'-diaponeurosporenoate glycosyltransferase
MVGMVLAALSLWLLAFLFLWRVPRCKSGYASTGSISFVIPARNEEATLPELLSSLQREAAGDYGRAGSGAAAEIAASAGSDEPSEVIVVDDHSIDDTARIAREFGATVLPSADLPEGWLGKTWACWQGAQKAGGETLVFLDADTRFEPGGRQAIRSCHGASPNGLVSFWPYHRMRRVYERLAAFFNIIIMASMNVFTVLGERVRPLGAFGPCMVCRRDRYMEVGGHRSVRSDILDDVALGNRFLAAGLPVKPFGGRGVVSFRMYPAGLGSLLTGFTKNMGSGVGSSSLLIMLLFVGWLTGAYITTFYFARSAILWSAEALPIWTAVYTAFVAQIHWMLRRLGNYTIFTALLFPLPLLFFSAVALASLFMTFVLRRVSWKGRTIEFGRRPGGRPGNGGTE